MVKQAAPTCRQAAPHPVSCRGVQILQRSLALDLQVLGLLLPVGQLLLLVLQAGSYRSQWLSFCSHPAQSYSSWHDPDGTALFREAVRLGLGTIRKTQTWTTCSEITEQTAAVPMLNVLCCSSGRQVPHRTQGLQQHMAQCTDTAASQSCLPSVRCCLYWVLPRIRHLTMISACACASCCLSTSSSV